MPGAPSRLLMTTAISAVGILPAAMLSARASKFEPRPLKSTPIRFFINGKTLAQPFESSKLVVVETLELKIESPRRGTEPYSGSSGRAGMAVSREQSATTVRLVRSGRPIALECRMPISQESHVNRGRNSHDPQHEPASRLRNSICIYVFRFCPQRNSGCRAAGSVARSGGAAAGKAAAEAAGATGGRRCAAGRGQKIDARLDREAGGVWDEVHAFFVDRFEAGEWLRSGCYRV